MHAQREACEAFIKSQVAEGWVAVADAYHDGGISGGTLERPALKHLLADIEAGRIDIVVVYKIDRLSRSLIDFARLPGWPPRLVSALPPPGPPCRCCSRA